MEIKRLRKVNNLSQSQLAEGICTQATISGIEAGKGYPSVDILYILSIRLKVTLDYFYKILLNDAQEYIQETEKYLEELLKKKNYEEAFQICSSELSQKNRQMGYKFDQIINWVYIVSSYYLKKMDFHSSINKLNALLDHSHPLYGQDFLDFKIQNSIAIIFAENQLYQESLEQYHILLSYKDFLSQHFRFHIKIYYNLSKLYFLLNDYEKSLTFANLGIKMSVLNEDISMAGQLYFQKGMSLEGLIKDTSEIKQSYQNSFFIFQLLNRDNYMEMVKEQKGKFLV
ncbi:helix-turn-helix domain-containing protein [Metabacillus sp. Hm71]|uniref:helix-turn-helix domain-containing protein n=1 Tax=Metabacillus sp. Hm71 TaxID=3450743 RepID=UPI003F42DD52